MGENYFELLGLPVSFDIDPQQLAENFRDLQRAVHPDRFANASDRERRLSMQRAAQINEAFQCLKSPQRRGRYLLELRGIEFDDERQTTLDPAFLMEQMELREALGEVRGAPDASTRLGEFMNQVAAHTTQMVERLGACLGEGTPDALEQARQLVQKLQFMERLRLEAEAMEEELIDAM
ncbi:MAG: co-chaperone HscB [Pseudomonadota bacterium]|nr:MAG: co-chaperone HscB [Pseudomonadota bacterium]